MSPRSFVWIAALWIAAIAATPAGSDLEHLPPDGALAEIAAARGVVLVDVYAEF